MSLSPEQEASFTIIIDSILAASDLSTISEKRIRKGLQSAVDYDISPQKDVIRALIMSRFDKLIAEQDTAKQTNGHVTPPKAASADSSPPVDPTPPPLSKKHKQEVDEEEVMSDDRRSPAPKKKRKVDHDSDAVLAAKLQALEDRSSRATRGGGPKKTSVMKKKKTPKKKTADKVKAEDDSDIEGSGSDAKEKRVNRSGGFHKELLLSPPLSALLDNEVKLSRPQTVKRIWAYVREHDLQDPKDKRMIRCDDGMRAVFKQDKVHMFTMNKILNQNLYNPEE